MDGNEPHAGAAALLAMGGRMKGIAARACLLATLSLALAACGSSWFGSDKKDVIVDPNLFPANYRKEIIDTMRSVLVDPNKVQNAGITDPFLAKAGADQRYVVCVRYNARDSFGHYQGPKDRIGYFWAGHLNQLVDPPGDQCAKAPYKPFPELEQLCAGQGCDTKR